MKKFTRGFAIGAAALLVGGCLSEAYLWWSPDGRTAAVRTADDLRLARANGRLSAPVLAGEVQSAAWLPERSQLSPRRTRVGNHA